MSSRRHLVVLARRYWPSSDDETLRLRDWVTWLIDRGCDVTIVTPKWKSAWPQRYALPGLHVEYVESPPTSLLRSRKHARTLATTLVSLAGKANAIYCESPDLFAQVATSEFTVASRSSGAAPPVYVGYESGPLSNGLARGNDSANSLGILRRADGVLAHSAAAHRALLSLGILERSILRQPLCLSRRVDRSQPTRAAARRMLYEANYELTVRASDRLVVCLCRFDNGSDIAYLVESLRRLAENRRDTRFWLVGDGGSRSEVYEALRAEGIHRLVALPGVFVSPIEMLQACDLCVLPPSGEGLRWFLPNCLRSSIPFLAPDIGPLRDLLRSCQCDADGAACLYPVGRDALETSLTNWLQAPVAGHELALKLGRRFVSENSCKLWQAIERNKSWPPLAS